MTPKTINQYEDNDIRERRKVFKNWIAEIYRNIRREKKRIVGASVNETQMTSEIPSKKNFKSLMNNERKSKNWRRRRRERETEKRDSWIQRPKTKRKPLIGFIANSCFFIIIGYAAAAAPAATTITSVKYTCISS